MNIILKKLLKKIILKFRSERVVYITQKSESLLEKKIIEKGINDFLTFDFNNIKDTTLTFLNSLEKENKISYYYTNSSTKTSLYSSAYAILIYSLYNDLELLSKVEKQKISKYFSSFQNEKDGLFYDYNIQNEYYNDSDWWGARHLNLHIINVFIALDEKPKYQFNFLKKYYDLEFTKDWLDSIDWLNSFSDENDIDNKLMNIAIALQYQRDFFSDQIAGNTVKFIQNYLISKININTGMWGDFDLGQKEQLSRMVQFAYHLLPIFEYDNIDLGYHSKYIDYALQTQNVYGGFGVRLNSSACEDMDSIYILILMKNKTDYKKKEIEIALRKAFIFILSNQNDDGGFVFRRDEKFWYGHEQMTSEINQSAMFPTWFRTLTLAYLSNSLGINGYNIVKSPGY